jgi:hypothetical protein
MSETRDAIDLLKSFTAIPAQGSCTCDTGIDKAQSAGKTTFPSEKQAQREYGHSFARFPRGEGGDPTPDMPDQGQDWHSTAAEQNAGSDPEEDGEQAKDENEVAKDPEDVLAGSTPTPVNLLAPSQEIQDQTSGKQDAQPPPPQLTAKSYNDMAIKALAGAPRFSSGPFVPPRERSFLVEQGFDPVEVDSGAISMTPRMRAEYNKYLLNAVEKSLSGLTTS